MGKVGLPVPDSKVTDAQSDEIFAELDEAEARLREVQRKARQLLMGEDDDGFTRCMVFECGCPFYKSPTSGHSSLCTRATCRHPFSSHDFR
jgi:hypothetical protein